MQLPGFGEEAQQKLASARVIVVGAGGLGCPVLMHLASAGVGTIAVADNDVVELSNLHRQQLFDTMDIGRLKAKAAADKLMLLNTSVQVFSYTDRITRFNALEIFRNYDIVVDCTDNFSSRYLINDACLLLQKPFVYGSVFQFEGQIAVLNYMQGATYRCIFSEPPEYGSIPDCSVGGILGVVAGITGTLQATEVIKMICQPQSVMQNQLLTWNAKTQTMYAIELRRNAEAISKAPKNADAFMAFNYPAYCGEPELQNILPEDFMAIEMSAYSIVDVRDAGELPVAAFTTVHIPFSAMESEIPDVQLQRQTIVFCNSGSRSVRAIPLLLKKFPDTEFINLQGGIQALNTFLQTQ